LTLLKSEGYACTTFAQSPSKLHAVSLPTFKIDIGMSEERNLNFIEEIIEEEAIPINVGMNVKFMFQEKERTGEVKELIPDKNSVKIKSVDPADNKPKLYTVALEKVSPIS